MSLGDWRDLSIILLAVEGIIIALIYGIIFYYLWKGFRVAHQWLQRTGLPQGQRYAGLAKRYTRYYSHKAVKPVVQAESKLGEVSGMVRALQSPSSHSRSRQERS
jgi:hypothetical protein